MAEIEIANRSSIPALATEVLFSLPPMDIRIAMDRLPEKSCVLPGSGLTPEYILSGIDPPFANGARGASMEVYFPCLSTNPCWRPRQRNRSLGFRGLWRVTRVKVQ